MYSIKKNVWGVLLAMAAISLASTGSVRGQQGGQQGTEQQAQPTEMNQQDSLRELQNENAALTAILRSIRSIDTARQNELIQWIITDRTIRSRVISALRKDGFRISPNSVAEMTVTQVPPDDLNSYQMQLIRVVIEGVGVYGQPTIERVLGSTLYDEINSRMGYQYTLISTTPEQQNIQFVAMNASLFGGDIIFKSGFGFGINVGEDWIGYPFWLPGTIGTYGLIRNGTTDFRLGIEWPLGESGATPFVISQGLQIRERKLVGAMAFSAEVKQDLGLLPEQSGKLHFGLEFRDAFTPNISSFPSFALQGQYRTGSGRNGINTAKDSLYYLALSTHAYVQYKMPDQVMRGAYIQVGAGMHSIQPVTVGVNPTPQNQNTDLFFDPRLNYFDPFVKLGYVHTGESGDEYGVSVQYCNTLLTDAWVNLFSWLQLEAKYSTVIGRDPQPWEWKDYVMVSPKIILNF